MLKELEPHEKELITLLRLCDPEDEVRILVKNQAWVIMTARNSRRVINVPRKETKSTYEKS